LACPARAANAGLSKNRQIGQNLAVHLDLRLLEAVHEGAVLHAELPGGGVDARDPEAAELTFALPTVAVGVLTGLHHRLLGDPIDVLATTAIALGKGENFLVARVRGYTTFDSGHLLSPQA